MESSDLRDENGIRTRERDGEFVLEDVATGRIATGFKGNPDVSIGIAQPESFDGFLDCRGVMPEVVNDGDVIHRGPNLHATFDALERGQCGLDLLNGNSAMQGTGNNGQGISDIQTPHHRQRVAIPLHGEL